MYNCGNAELVDRVSVSGGGGSVSWDVGWQRVARG